MNDDEFDVIRQAVTRLNEHWGYPPWLTGIGVGSKDGQPAIHVLLKFTPKLPVPVLAAGSWEGFPIVTRVVGQIIALGSAKGG